jgi:hypothetical protein
MRDSRTPSLREIKTSDLLETFVSDHRTLTIPDDFYYDDDEWDAIRSRYAAVVAEIDRRIPSEKP